MVLRVADQLPLLMVRFPTAQAVGYSYRLSSGIRDIVGIQVPHKRVLRLKGIFKFSDPPVLRDENFLDLDEFHLRVGKRADQISQLELELGTLLEVARA